MVTDTMSSGSGQRGRERNRYSYLDIGVRREMAARSTIESIVLRVEYCRWGVRRSAGIVVRSALNIEWDELKQTYPSKEFDVRMPSSASNLPAGPGTRVPKPAGVDILRSPTQAAARDGRLGTA